ncbi:MAG: hypothetical protein HYX80_04605 [Chloroflexi bacterium]|nr:hypothetical protein [Chloroflexota bacterium]
MKKKPITILATIAASISLGYAFLPSWLLGFFASRYVAGKRTGQSGRLKSIVIPVRTWRLHLHHWLYSTILLGLSAALGLYLLSPTITYGVLAGSIFHGIYFYNDWHVVAARNVPE